MDFELTPQIAKEIEDLSRAVKSIPSIMLNICLKTGINEVKGALSLMPEKTKILFQKELEELSKKLNESV